MSWSVMGAHNASGYPIKLQLSPKPELKNYGVSWSVMGSHNASGHPIKLQLSPKPELKSYGVSWSVMCCPSEALWAELKRYLFLRQVSLKDAKSDRNCSIWPQLVCALTGAKHHNLQKTYKSHGFPQNFIQNDIRYTRETWKIQKNTKKTEKYIFVLIFSWFFVNKNITFFQKKSETKSQKKWGKWSFFWKINLLNVPQVVN